MTITIDTEPIPLIVDPNGTIRVGNTRVTLESVVVAYLEGATAEEIAQQYPSLELADIYAVIGYYLRRRSEVEDYLQLRRRQAEEVRKQNEARFPTEGVHARLLARKRQQGG